MISQWLKNKENYPHKRLFKNDFLESFSFVHPILPILIYGPDVMYLLYRSSLSITLTTGVFGFGIFAWTLTEYLLHRFAFHFEAKSDFGKKIVYLIHGVHHDDPNDPLRLVAPPIMSITLSVPFIALFSFLFSENFFHSFLAGFFAGYLCYDYIHYYTHHFIPKSKLGKFLRKYHFLHHYKEPGKRYGVSNPFWDIVFRTYS